MEIPGTEFLTLDWIIRSIRLTTVSHLNSMLQSWMKVVSINQSRILMTLQCLRCCIAELLSAEFVHVDAPKFDTSVQHI